MRFRTITADGDWTLGRGRSGYAVDGAAIELDIITRLRSWKGNCFFDLDAGINWAARMDKNQRDNLLNDLRFELIRTVGVVGVNSVTVSQDTVQRTIVINYDVDTIFSTGFKRRVEISAAPGITT